MHDLQTIIRLNKQPVNQRTPALAKAHQISGGVRQEWRRCASMYRYDIPALDRVAYGTDAQP